MVKAQIAHTSDISDRSNLTQSQFLMWLGQRLAPETPLYNMIFTFDIGGEIDPALFQAAFKALVAQSDALRTIIQEIEGVPQQRVLPHFPYQVSYLDLSEMPDAEAAFQAWLEARTVIRFDLAQRLYDSTLVKLAPERYIWYLNQHHIITDAWSAALIYQRLAEFYRLAQEDLLETAPTLPDYQAYVRYERSQRETAACQKALAYWQEKLGESYQPTPFYGKVTSGKTARTRRISCRLNAEQTYQLKCLADAEDIRLLSRDLTLSTLFATLLFAFLHRISGQERLRIGTPFHNRSSATWKETMGLFIEIGFLQVNISPEETFISLLKQVRNETFTNLRYVQSGISRAEVNRAYDVLLNYVHASYPDFAGLPMRSAWIHPGYGDSSHGLRLQVHDLDGSGNFVLHFDFNTEVFDEPRQQWAIQHFLRLIDAFLADRTQAINGVDLLSEAEKQSLLRDFNRTDTPYPASQTVVQLFESQVEATPEAVAARCGEQELSYLTLNRRANQLARYLQAQGVGPESLVPIYMYRSLEVLLAILGVLKAGGAYVPIDPAYPGERVAFMLADLAQARPETPLLLLTQAALLEHLPETEARFICLDTSWEPISAYDDKNLDSAAVPHHLAYVIYTSGSTGRPKGTMIEHRGLVNYLWWAKAQYLQGQTLDFPLFSSLSFDLTVTSIFLPLISGGKIVVYSEPDLIRGMEILRVVEDNAVDIIKLTPAHLALIREARLSNSRVRRLIVGGEDFKTGLARTIHEAFNGKVEIYNEYGPTEAVVGCMIHRYRPEVDLDGSVPIGKPAANARIYLLDRHLKPVPPGLVGEMYIASDGLARGYLNRPELTAEKFVPNPFYDNDVSENSTPDSSFIIHHSLFLYRTGDLARWQANGQMEFLGRLDHQVKIRGARIELNEIETTLLSHPDISACVVDVVQYEQNQEPAALRFCLRCGLPSNYPGAGFDEQGICQMCRFYDGNQDQIARYFKTEADLHHLVETVKAARSGPYDCLVLYSGGKDSTYMLVKLVELGLHPLVFNFDNGYISEGAKTNMRRITSQMGLHLWVEKTPAMPSIFADSLKRYSNVCNGCFKAIYTLSLKVARRHGLKYIFTGLSRGQLFETRLNHLFRDRLFAVENMDAAVLEARKLYHRQEDAASKLLAGDLLKDDTIFEETQFIDFYRYVDVRLEEMLQTLNQRLGWVRPEDTGRSTNCLINEVGIYIHQKERGYHNYALPYSWDVRLGHKSREAALEELDDQINVPTVKRILAEIGYESNHSYTDRTEKRLAAYYLSKTPLTVSGLRAFLMERVPDYMIPSYFIHLEALPLTPNGKIDRSALPNPAESRPELGAAFVAPRTLIEAKLAGIWAQTLNLKRVGIYDDFFELGGASVPAVQILARIAQSFQVELPLRSIFEAPTVAGLSEQLEAVLLAELEEMSDEEAEQLLAQME